MTRQEQLQGIKEILVKLNNPLMGTETVMSLFYVPLFSNL